MPRPDQPPTLKGLVDTYEAAAAQATRLSAIDARALTDHRTNPRVLADQIAAQDQADRELIQLDHDRRIADARAEHRRGLSRIAAADRWARALAAREDRAITSTIAEADAAAADVAAVTEAQAMTRPATGAARLARTQERIANTYLALGAGGSILSGLGLAHAFVTLPGVGWATAVMTAVIIEVPTTVLVAMIVWAQGYLARHTFAATTREADGTRVRLDALRSLPAWARWLPWGGAAGLLLAVVGIQAWGLTVHGTGIYGVAGMVGAGIATLASFLSWAYSLQASAIIQTNMAAGGVAADLAERRRVAAGAYIHLPDRDVQDDEEGEPRIPARPEVVDAATEHAELVRRIIAQAGQPDIDRVFTGLVADLDLDDGDDDGDGGGGSDVPGPSPRGTGPAATAEEGASPADLRTPHPASPSASPAASGGASPEAHPRQEDQDPVLAYLAHCQRAGETPTVRGAARYAGVDPRTVRRRRDALAAAGHDMSPLMAKQPK
ncbi:hypothetical protein ACQEU5_24765 [Marinactinospora thermotolerans]|uniref:hypothetical protein n=1 Tax=Marinactinospora thermotolerans TaxID=531310 RepID=UPI003D8E8AFD